MQAFLSRQKWSWPYLYSIS